MGVSPYLAVRPISALIGWFKVLPGSSNVGFAANWANESAFTRLPVSESVRLGMTSSVRSVEMPSNPVRCPSWLNCDEMSREIGIHESISSLKRSILRQT